MPSAEVGKHHGDPAMGFAANTVSAGLLVVLGEAVVGERCSLRVRVRPLEVFPDAGQRANQLRPQPSATIKLLETLAWGLTQLLTGRVLRRLSRCRRHGWALPYLLLNFARTSSISALPRMRNTLML